jgi:hypothetical protein
MCEFCGTALETIRAQPLFNKLIILIVMKTRIATIMLLLGLFVASTAFAADPVPATKEMKKEIKELVKKKLHYPQFAIDSKTELTVYLSINVMDDGSLEIDCANCSCCKMKDFVIKNIEKIDSEDLVKYAGQNMLLKVRFYLI